MPSTVTFSDGSTITYSYAANGTKLRTVHTISGTTTTKDYCANVVYENGIQKILLTEEGYVDLSASTPAYYYYLKDHQGNNRVVINGSGTVQETNHYYPFGGVFASTGNVQPYKYNGKELDTKKGLNWYDYGARHYDATLSRWFVVDPKAEDLMKWSLYSYCYDNPIKFVDPDGMQGRPPQRPIRKNLRNGGSSIGIYEFFNLPKPQSTRTVTTYKYRGGMLREKMALGEQNYVKNVTVGDNTVQMTNNNNVGMRFTGQLGLLNNAKEFSKQLLNMSTETIYHNDGRVYKNTFYIIQDPVLAEMQREYTELYNYHSEQLGDELSLLEKHGIIQSKIGIPPLWTIIMDMLMNPDNYEADTQLRVIPEFRQGK